MYITKLYWHENNYIFLNTYLCKFCIVAGSWCRNLISRSFEISKRDEKKREQFRYHFFYDFLTLTY